jgi:tetratricopeptide (TPR) repeat protein
MPNLKWIFLVFLSAFSLLPVHQADCQVEGGTSLSIADSLFADKKYQEALQHYEHILYDEKAYSPAMLLKMGFISEGMGDFGKASLFLSKYYDYNPNPEVITKIKSLTGQTNLEGYRVSDQDRFLRFLLDYKTEITGTAALLMLVFLIMVFVFPVKRSVFYYPAMLFLLITFVSNNYLNKPDTGIITGGPVLIMDSPSSAGNLIRRVEAGHRVVITSSQDMWYEVQWGNKSAFIRKADISKI